MPHDLVLRGGTVVDGTGAEPKRADVAIDGDRITAVGSVDSRGRRELDVEGRLVTPGFVDIHTHLDAQLAWDPIGSSSCWHGVTTVAVGNCGVTFAPVRTEDHTYLAEMMESVEDIPARSILEGLPWNWETYGEYLGWLDSTPKGVNAGGMVGHCALRYYAMGERSLDEDATPSDDELDRMTALTDEALTAGALGFSSSRTLRHRVPDGRFVPGTYAKEDELFAFADLLGRHGRGVIEVAPRFDGEGSPLPRVESEMAWITEASSRSGRPITFGLSHTWEQGEHYRRVIELAREANARGAQVRPQTTPRYIGVLTGIAHRTPFDRHQAWHVLQGMPLSERLGLLRDPARRADLVDVAIHDRDGLDVFFLLNGPDGLARVGLPARKIARGRGRCSRRVARRGVHRSRAGDRRRAVVVLAAAQPERGCDRRDADATRGALGPGRRGGARGPDDGRQRAHASPHILGARAGSAHTSRRHPPPDVGHGKHVRNRGPWCRAGRHVRRPQRDRLGRARTARPRVRLRLPERCWSLPRSGARLRLHRRQWHRVHGAG